MGINRNIVSARASVMWNGGKAADVRGLTPADVSKIFIQEGEGLIDLIKAFDSMDTRGVNFKDTDAVATLVMDQAMPMLAKLATDAPRFLAAIIAIAGSNKEDDILADTADVEENWPLPLQFECLKEIARMTFVGPDGFRLFLGNVSALASVVGGMTSAPTKRNPSQIQAD